MASSVEDDRKSSVGTEQHHHQPPPPPLKQQQPAQPYVPGYEVSGTGHVAEDHSLPCFGIGLGWLLFILGFILGAIPWYVGFFLLLCSKNRRERPGYIACAIGSAFATIFIVIGIIRAVAVQSHYNHYKNGY